MWRDSEGARRVMEIHFPGMLVRAKPNLWHPQNSSIFHCSNATSEVIYLIELNLTLRSR